MKHPQSFGSFRDPAFSLWQAAVHGTLLKHAQQGKTGLANDARGIAKTAEHPYMDATVDAIHDLTNSVRPSPRTLQGKPQPEDLRRCAKLAASLAWAEVFDRARLPALRNEFNDSVCDPFWSECYAEYEWMTHSGNGEQPYIGHGGDLSKFVIHDCFGEEALLAFISDWGTGANEAIPVFPPEPEADRSLVLPEGENAPPTPVQGTLLANNGTVFNHAYAMVSLDGPAMTVDYYQIASSGADPKRPPALDRVYREFTRKPLAKGGKGLQAVTDTWWSRLRRRAGLA